ncbi:MAG: family 43 glycosylhydrolase [Eubacterium sp.]|nr:family 43 glycosylhydrolase [Eubacterium sp.]
MNPYLPLDEYVADAEPHVFGDRIYVFGSHDRANATTFCARDYVGWSAPVDDLGNWTCAGTIYSAKQDPDYNANGLAYMYAPDCVRGNDGRYYLYYCMAGYRGKGGYSSSIHVAVADEPDGRYTYLGFVQDRDGNPLKKYICFDPAVINDDGVIRLYYGAWYGFVHHLPPFAAYRAMQNLYGRTLEDIRAVHGEIDGPCTVELEDDMLTARTEPVKIAPDAFAGGGHPFFEGSSIRAVRYRTEKQDAPASRAETTTQTDVSLEGASCPDDEQEASRQTEPAQRGESQTDADGDEKYAEKKMYIFVYSSWQNHELCYATSENPDHGFTYRGTIVSNGDIYLDGRKPSQRLNHTGTNHGGIEYINGQWYVFYHRLTNMSDYSRQGCAEPIDILEDGTIEQVEMTSCGLNGGPLAAEGTYPAAICCNLTNGRMRHGGNAVSHYNAPKIMCSKIPGTHGREEETYVGQIGQDTIIGYKYFQFTGEEVTITVTVRGRGEGTLYVITGYEGDAVAEIEVEPSGSWRKYSVSFEQEAGAAPLYLAYDGKGQIDLLDLSLG